MADIWYTGSQPLMYFQGHTLLAASYTATVIFPNRWSQKALIW